MLNVIIMAGGEGKRMNSDIPKVLHNFIDQPFLVRIINEVNILSPKKIIVVVGKYEELIKLTLSKYNINNIIFVRQPIPLGTGDAIKYTLDIIDENSDVLILNGDMPLIKANTIKNFISDLNFAKLMIAKLDNPNGYGRIIFNNDKFVKILEDKECNDEEKLIDLVNVGIYFFKDYILKKYILEINNNNSQNEYYLTDIIKLIYDIYEIETYQIEQELNYQILGINTKKELDEYENLYKYNIYDS